MKTTKTNFFTKDPAFYSSFFKMMVIIALQNLIAYSVNMADNLMLGSYSQVALSGAAASNQIFFMVQQIALALGNAMVVLGSQYWGERRIAPIRKVSGYVLKITVGTALAILLLCMFFPEKLIHIFTTSPEITEQAMQYLQLVQWTFVLFMISNMLMSILRCVETVQISFYISLISLIVNVGINYTLIFGKFGFPEMGIRGAAIGTIVARGLEFFIIIIYVARIDQKLDLFQLKEKKRLGQGDLFKAEIALKRDYNHAMIPIVISQMVWAISVPLQTAILGHMSSDAIAANAISSTFYAYLKTIIIAMASTSSVMIGKAIGQGDETKIKAEARSLSMIDLLMGIVLGTIIILIRQPLLSCYSLTEEAFRIADHLFLIMGFTMACMAYQMTVSVGLIQGSGDGKFMAKLNLTTIWLIVIPLSLLSAFVWKLPIEVVALMTQIDQPVKCVPVFIHFCSYKWIKKMTR